MKMMEEKKERESKEANPDEEKPEDKFDEQDADLFRHMESNEEELSDVCYRLWLLRR